MKNLITSLFTSYSISAFLYYYLPIESLMFLFLGFLGFTSIVHFKFQDSPLSKSLINVSTSIQLTYTIVFLLFDKLQINTPVWLVYRDEVITLIGFIALSLISSLIINKNVNKVFLESSIASAMGLAILFSTMTVYGTYKILLFYPLFSLCLYLFISGKKSRIIEVSMTTLLIAYGGSFLLADFISSEVLTGFDLMFSTTWLATMIAAFLFMKEEKAQVSYSRASNQTKPSENSDSTKDDEYYIPYHIRHENRGSYNHYNNDRYDKRDYNYNSYQSSIFDDVDDDRKESKPYSDYIPPTNHQNANFNEPSTSSNNIKPNEAPDLYGLSDAERSKVINEEFYGMPSWYRDKKVEEREFGLPSYARTDIDKLDD